jgi:hypothetical protein
MNQLDMTNKPAFDEHPIMNQWLETHDFYIQYHNGILCRRRPASVRRLYSTA